MAYYLLVEFFETPKFTELILDILQDDEESYFALQDALCANPDIGDKIPGTKGLRKVRWAGKGRGKRGGIRVIYFYKNDRDQIFMLYVFPKNKQSDLTLEQEKILGRIVSEEWK